MRNRVYLTMLAAAMVMLSCNPPGGGEEGTGNRIKYDGKNFPITLAGQSYEGAVYLYFEAGDDIGVEFEMYPDGSYSLASGRYTYASEPSADYGKPGTFAEGVFYMDDNDESCDVISGILDVSVENETYGITADCLLADGRSLTIIYTGNLDYDGPTGTSTFEVQGRGFPVASAALEEYGGIDNMDLFCSRLMVVAIGGNDDRYLEFRLDFFHTEETLTAGTYTWPSIGNGTVGGEFEVYAEDEDLDLSGEMSAGQVDVEIIGDRYRFTFKDVEFYSVEGSVPISGVYEGSVAVGVVFDELPPRLLFSGKGDLQVGGNTFSYLNVARSADAYDYSDGYWYTPLYIYGDRAGTYLEMDLALITQEPEFLPATYVHSAAAGNKILHGGIFLVTADQGVTEVNIDGGSLKIEESGDNYLLTFDMTAADDGSIPISGAYTGRIVVLPGFDDSVGARMRRAGL